MKKLIAYIFLYVFPLFPVGEVWGCINLYSSTVQGKIVAHEIINVNEELYSLKKSPEQLKKLLAAAEKNYQEDSSIYNYSNLGAAYIYNGRYEEALKIYKEIELKSPGLYNTASNMGTLYEIMGKNQLAYEWIEKALQINKESHHGSEWIHLNILRYKLAPDVNFVGDILGIDFGNGVIPSSDSIDLNKLRLDLYYQLKERISFIPPKDPIIAQLLFDLGNTCALVNNVKEALQVYAIARKYGFSSEILDSREKYFTVLQSNADTSFRLSEIFGREDPLINILLVSVPVVIFILFNILMWYILYKRKKKSKN